MADCGKKYFSPRLLDYIVIVGTRTPCSTQSVQMPQLLRRYPPENHKDFPLPPDVVFFCQPEGCINTDIRRLSPRDTHSFVFALTEKDTSRVRYGICMNFYRRFEIKTPRCSKSCDDDGSTGGGGSSGTGGEDLKQKSTDQSDDSLPNKEKIENEDQQKQKKGAKMNRRHVSQRCLSLISLCIISHHPFFSTFRECLSILKKMIQMFSQRNCDRKHRRDLVWTLLTTRFTQDFTKIIPENVIQDVCAIETWCLRILSAPVPVPGKTKVELEILDPKLKSSLILALPDHTRFTLVDFPLHLPLELLGVDTCVKVLTMIMMEHKVVIQSRDYNALSMSVMAFVTIIYPFEYMFPVIPLLPTCMNSAEQLLLAPTPYIIGVPSSFLLYKKNFRLPDDVWLVDLDTNKIIKPSGADELPSLPDPEGSTLKNHFKQVLASMSISTPSPTAQPNRSGNNIKNNNNNQNQITTFDPLSYGNDIDSVDIAARIAMIKFFNSNGLLLNFSEYTRTIRLFPRPVVAFQINSFLHSRPKSSVFLTKFVQTQAVEYFAEWSLCPDNVAFIRVQNGVHDPLIIGDKAKWYSHQLDSIMFKVCTEDINSKLIDIFNEFNQKSDQESELAAAAADSDEEEEDDDESIDEISTSSSISSLNEFEEIYNVRCPKTEYLNTLKDVSDSSFTLCDARSIFHPPDTLLTSSSDVDSSVSPKITADVAKTIIPATDQAKPESTKKAPKPIVIRQESMKIRRASQQLQKMPAKSDTSASSSSSAASSDSESETDSEHEFRPKSLYDNTDLNLPDLAQITSDLNKKIATSSDTDISEQSRSSTPKIGDSQQTAVRSQKSSSSSIQNISPSNSIDKSSGTSTPTLAKAMSISSVFSRSQSQSSSQPQIQAQQQQGSLLNRLTNEAKDMAREAKAVAKEVVKPGQQGTKKKFLAKLQDFGEPLMQKSSAKEFWRMSKEEDSDSSAAMPLSSSSSSIMSSMSTDFNGLADKTAGMLSGFFSKSNLQKVKEKSTQPFGPFPKGKKGLIEKSNLIRHSTNQAQQMLEQQKKSKS